MVNIGIIGAGNIAKMHALAYQEISDAKVVSVADINQAKAQSIADMFNANIYSDITELLDKKTVDMVDICLPSYLHKQNAIYAFEHGVHVLCEKPIALCLDDAIEMVETAKTHDAKFMVGYCLRFSDEYIFLKNCIEDRQYGTLLSLNLYRHSFLPKWSEGTWLLDVEKSGGMLLDLHIHDTDMVLYLMGKPASVTSFGTQFNISTLYEYTSTVVYAEASWRDQASFPFFSGYDAFFENATVMYKDNTLKVYQEDSIKEIKSTELPKEENDRIVIGNLSDDYLKMFYNEIKYFIDCVQKDIEPYISLPESSIMSLNIAFSEKQSAHEQKKIWITK